MSIQWRNLANMPIQTIKIETIFDGQQPSQLFGQADEFLASIGIDPDMPRTDTATDKKAGGVIRPVNYEKLSGSNVDSYPIAILTTPKDSNVYTILKNGKVISYNSSLGSETLIGQLRERNAEGAWYYNNYIYITTSVNVARYGPLDGTPSLNNTWWSSLSLTAMTINDYPQTLLSVPYLKHHGISHVDGSSYFLDYINGTGYVHQITTSKNTNEGDTNNGSEYGLLDFPFNYMPLSICSMGNNMVVSASLTQNGNIQQGKAAWFFFNPADTIPSFYHVVHLPDTICPAMIYANGYLYGWAGDLDGGYRLVRYLGGDTVETLKYIEEGNAPMQNAIDAIANKLLWAADSTIPMTASGVYGYGSKSDLFPRGLHHVAIAPFTT